MSSAEIHLSAESRHEFGKGAARRLRRADRVPAVVYGHGEDPLHLSLPGHETMLALKHRNAVLTLDVEGTEHLAFAKFVQRDPIKGFIEHVDFVTVRRGEKIQVDVAVVTHGDPIGGTVVTVEHNTIAVLADAMNLPESVDIDVEGFEAGHSVLAKDVKLPAGVELVTDPESIVVNVTETRLEAALEAAELEVGAGATAAAAAAVEDEAAQEDAKREDSES
ncbi:50S ribosomal protein L25/general stress protein Ctc [Jannaschia sp. R86511]|uniref:50S ribosomal protein L25/general stress protein Ctc n=1 Tax=Jannaschia sp. R86511 TaxID=3093853 RepID=UPI0036D39D06